MMRKMEQAVATFSATPTMFERNIGVIVIEIQSVAPLMRRDDRSTIRDVGYVQTIEGRSTGFSPDQGPDHQRRNVSHAAGSQQRER